MSPRSKLIATLCLVIVAGATARTAMSQTPDRPASAADIGITYFEPLVLINDSSKARGAAQKTSTQRLTFDAYGRRFELQLEPNDRIAPPALARSAPADSLKLMRGFLVNVPGSWVRLTSTPDGRLSGMIWDGSQTYLVEPAAAVLESLLPPLVASDDQTLIFRLADTLISPNVAFCQAPAPVADKPRSGQDAYDSLIHELRAGMKGGTVGLQATDAAQLRLEMSVLGDKAFSDQFGGEVEARKQILNRMNIVDGIFSNQLGVAIQVPIIKVDAAATQTLSAATDASALLSSLGTVRSASAELRSKGLTHLFTGRDLDGTTVGIAYRDSLCRNQFGAGLTEARTRGAGFEALIAAHEIGHNFGAVHDGEAPTDPSDPDCSATPRDQFLMSPSVSQNVDTFSSCSKNLIQPRILAASCVTALPPADLSVAADLGTLRRSISTSFELLIPVTNLGGITATGAIAELLVPPSVVVERSEVLGGSCTSAAGVIRCEMDNIAGGTRTDIELKLRSNTLGTNSISIRVSADSDSQANNNSGDGTIIIDPETNLGIDLQAPDTAVLGTTFQSSFSVSNLAGIDSGSVTVDIELPAGISALSGSLGGGPCTLQVALVRCTLSVLAANGSAMGVLSLSAQAAGAQLIRARAIGTFVDPDAANNVSDRTITVTASATGGQSAGATTPVKRGGGGATDGLILLCLALAAASRKSWARSVTSR